VLAERKIGLGSWKPDEKQAMNQNDHEAGQRAAGDFRARLAAGSTAVSGLLRNLYNTMMPDQPTPEIELLRAAYVAFNARDIDAALALMTPDVAWPKAFKGGFVRGPEEVRAYWTEQWSEIDPHVEPVAFHPGDDGIILVEVHQVVRDLAGGILGDERVGHRFTIVRGLIEAMAVSPLPS
jgi:hypothetical protein